VPDGGAGRMLLAMSWGTIGLMKRGFKTRWAMCGRPYLPALPAQSSVLHCGNYLIAGREEVMIEVMPAQLSEREFPKLMHSKQLTPGFRQSPAAEKGVAICFARATPVEGAAEAAVAAGVAAWQLVCRAMLRLHGWGRAGPARHVIVNVVCPGLLSCMA
jgi:hypothetical protein